MKKSVLTLFCVLLLITVFAQVKKPASTAAKARTAVITASPLKSAADSFNYALGLNIGTYMKQLIGQQGVSVTNNDVLITGIRDVFKGNKALLKDSIVSQIISSTMMRVQQEKAAVNKKAGAAFLAANKSKAGVVTLPSGLQYIVLKEGSGAKPSATDNVKVHYHGTLIDGTIFDSSVDRGEPIVLNAGQVIKGWTEALQMMPIGSKWKLFIPSELGYGDNSAGSIIKAGSSLIFDVELLNIEPKQSEATK